MATLQKIRNHGVTLIVIVGLAMLAFILGDFLNSGSSFFNRNRENIAEIAGQDIHYTEYETAKDQLTEVYKIETGRNDFDEDATAQIRNQVWQLMVADYTLRWQGKKIGMTVTPEELSELCIGSEPHQLIRDRRAFYDENGEFNRNQLVRFLASLEQEVENAEQAANLQQAKTYWLYWENAVRLTQMQDKYTNLLQSLFKANSLEAQYAYNGAHKTVSADYVMKPYYAISDSLVKVSNSKLKKLYRLHHSKYKQTPNRAIEYVSFAVKPSEQDYADTKELLEKLQETFYTTEDVALTVNPNSDILYDGRDYSAETVPAMFAEFAFRKDAKAGDVTPLLFDNDTYAMARIMECGYSLPDSVELKAIATEEGQEDVELGWYQASQLQKAIAEPAFHGKRGEQFTVSQGMGERTFEIMDMSPATPKVKLAILSREVSASSNTYSTLYNKAKQFIVNNPTEDAFHSAAKEEGLTIHPQFNLNKNTDKVGELKSSRQIVRWAFEAKEGQVSDVFECGDQFVVAILTEVHDDTYRTFNEVKNELQMEALNEAKAEYVAKEIEGYNSLEEAAEKMGQSIQHAEDVNLASYRFGNSGAEPTIIGTAISMEPNEISQPIAGITGVYVLKVTGKSTKEGELDINAEKKQLSQRYAYLPYQALQLIQDKADITDNRYNFQ